jgi:glycosyltransferase involved in cell wall biosynthesis
VKRVVLHVVVAGEVGGAERMLVDLARSPRAGSGATAEIGSREHVVALMTPSERLRSLLRDAELDLEDHGPIREDPAAFLRRSLGRRDVAWLEGVARRRGAEILHLHTFGSQVLGTRAALRAGARIVRTEHSTRVFDDPSCWPFSRWSLRRADASVAISEHVRRVALAKAPWAAPRLRVVPNGIDVARFAAAPAPHAEDEDGGRVRFVASGRLEPRKGLDVALAALREVPAAELEIAGEGEAREALGRLAARLGVGARVRFTGFASDVRPLLARADLALSSARSEGLGIALLEAMATGRPVVALPTGGVPEIVRDGETGWLAHGRDATALARAMRDAVEAGAEERARRGARARRLVEDGYSVETMRARYEAVYASVEAPEPLDPPS